ncbi:LOW QUALITY PROTEIN: uncharacterized protein LOC121385244 [Gigantopelta aegis]|uniref:LOW QUALITY PROTEIN: uncharacterized protein LOC121385244 n=1 Tax=Gigantopelta aegis TaxID=1735272 RepID=UPI001B88C3C1|nr:LOW QUALITY PROTEIN: uncharacterized protein LOC121385244 [Gigantopelta aegis]
MELHDDDISILHELESSSNDDVDGYFNVSHSCVPQHILPSTAPRSSTALYALQTAYSDLKNRYNELAVRNHSLARTLRDVKKLHTSGMSSPSNDGDLPPISYNSQGAAAMAEAATSSDQNSDLGAQQGFIRYLQRELLNAQTQLHKFDSVKASYSNNLEKMQTKYKQVVEEDNRKGKEIAILQQRLGELEAENQTLKEQLDDCQRQLHEAEIKISQGPVDAQPRQRNEAGREGEAAGRGVRTHAHGRRDCAVVDAEKDREIDDLQGKVVELETEYKDQVESLSLASIPANEELMQLKKVIRGLKETVHQQNAFLTKFVRASSLFEPAATNPSKRPATRPAAMIRDELHIGRQAGGRSISDGSIMVDSPLLKVSLPPTAHVVQQAAIPFVASSSPARQHVPEETQSEVFSSSSSRRLSPRPQTEHSRSQGDLYQLEAHGRVGFAADLLSEENFLVSSYDNTPVRQNVVPGLPQQPNVAGYVSPKRQNVTGQNMLQRQNGSGYDLLQRQNGSGYDLTQRQTGSGYDLTQRQTGSGYDLTQRQNGSGYDLTQQPTGSGYDLLNRRVSDLEMMSPRGGPSRMEDDEKDRDATCERNNSSHVCPVCSVDFNHYSMDEFQTHVFECFDDSDAPETLHAEQTTTTTTSSGSKDRICPMCSALFPESVPQQEFETHVQTHFEDGSATGFEVIQT